MRKERMIMLVAIPLTFLSFSRINAQIANFSFDTSGSKCAPYQMVFTQRCAGNPVAFLWNFGNKQRGNKPVETVTYGPGTYSVTLTAVYRFRAFSVTKKITINPTPTISLTASKNQLCRPGEVSFKTTASFGVKEYEWDFGDSSAVEVTETNAVSHNYTDPGVFTATVKVVNEFGCRVSNTSQIKITKFALNGKMSITNGCVPSEPIFSVNTDLPEGDVAVNYNWNFADGSEKITTTENKVKHRYTTTDSIFAARVVVSTKQGCSSEMTFRPFAFGSPPFNNISMTSLQQDSFCGSETIKFNSKATNANQYLWTFEDSTEQSIQDTITSYKFHSVGSKRIFIMPSFNGCEGEKDSIDIFIKGVIASYNYGNLCNDKNAYKFKNSSLGKITHYQWEFTDNENSKDSIHFNLTHRFPSAGSFKTILSLYDSTTGCTDTAKYNIYTAVPTLTRSLDSVCKDSLVKYIVANSYPDSANYIYDFFVNGRTISNSTDSILNFFPSTRGGFNEYVVISDAVPGTCSDTLQFNTNEIVRGPIAEFRMPGVVCIDRGYALTNLSKPFYETDAIVKWSWDWGDETQVFIKDPPAHSYKISKGYTVKLTVTDVNGCANTTNKPAFPAPLPQIFSFPAEDTICLMKDTTVLEGYTIDTLTWLPSSHISCTSCDTTTVYPLVTTSYFAKAKSRFGCISYDTSIIRVYNPVHVNVFPKDTFVCPGQPIPYRIDGDGIPSWSPSSYLNNSNIGNPSATPVKDIVYTVTVRDSVGCFTDSAVATAHVFPHPAVYAGDDIVLPYNSSFTIIPQYDVSVVSALWQPATNLNCSNCSVVTGVALKSTTYTVKTTSINGCRSSDKITVFVKCETSNLLLPTAFSPNGDGLNDYFYPIGRGYRIIKKFMIFNRNGNTVFQRQDFTPNIATSGWNGLVKNADHVSSTEAFTWFIEAECDQGQTVVSNGTVVLLR
jgi:gliding motility-associated-like protein